MVRLFLIVAGVLLLTAGQAGAEDEFVIHPDWTRTPSGEDMQRLYPRQARGVTGRVQADCLIDERGRFSACEIVSETPAGKGFAESTHELAKLFRMKARDGDGRLVAGRKVHLPVIWHGGFYQ